MKAEHVYILMTFGIWLLVAVIWHQDSEIAELKETLAAHNTPFNETQLLHCMKEYNVKCVMVRRAEPLTPENIAKGLR